MKNVLTILIVFLSFNQVKSQTLNGDKKEIHKILKNTKAFSEYVMTSDYDNIDASYTRDAKIFPNNTKILEGAAIRKYWTLPKGVSVSHHKIFQEEITIVKDTAYDYGYYEGKTKNEKGEESSWGGKYVIVWKKEDGNWKMHLDIWNSVN